MLEKNKGPGPLQCFWQMRLAGIFSGSGWVLPLFLLLAAAIYGYRLHFPDRPYFDEIHYVKFIREFFAGQYNQYASNHPPLWHFLTATGMKILGDHSWVWRLVSVTAGVGCLGALYFLTRRLTGDHKAALLAVFFWMFDCLSLTQARVAMMNSLYMFSMLVSLFFFIDAIHGRKEPDLKKLFFSGLFFGCALSSKFVAFAMLLIFVPLAVFYVAVPRKGGPFFWFWMAVCFIEIPAIIFFFVHWPMIFAEGRTILDLWNVTVFHVQYHATTTQTHPYMSAWWGWPIIMRPLCAFFETNNGKIQDILFIGNPVVFWSIPLAIGFAIWKFFQKRFLLYAFILVGFFSQWLMYAMSTRPKFFHYFYSAMPFVAIAFALLARRLWIQGLFGRIVVVVFMLLTLGMFIYWYPLLTAFPVSHKFYGHHMWFKSWI